MGSIALCVVERFYMKSTDQKKLTIVHEKAGCREAWVAQLVKHPTLDFGSGHDLRVCEMESHTGFCAERGACLRFSVSAHAHSKIKKTKIKNNFAPYT